MSAAAIVLAGLGYSTPDGRALFTDLDLSFGPERTGLVGRNSVGKTTLLRLLTGELRPQAGSVEVRGRLAVLRQAVQVDPGATVADLFGVREGLAVLARAERGEADEADLAAADWTLEARLEAALAGLGLAVEPAARLEILSGGQRTRAALAALVFAEPDMLILDEPTNNLDRDGRTAVADLLAGWRAGAIVVSHDRDLLERMDSMVELTALGATRYGGGWSRFQAAKAEALAAAEQALAIAERRRAEVGGQVQLQAERQARRDGAGRRKAARGDMPKLLAGMRKDRAEDTGGGNARLAERRKTEADADLAAARRKIEILTPFAIALPSTGLAAQKTVLSLEAVDAGHAPDRPVIRGLSLRITGPERIAIVGPNGAGKSTLLAVIAGTLAPSAGVVRRMTNLALFDQSVSALDPEASVRDNFLRMNPGADENACRAALARFMFRADAALQRAGDLSGGQLLRAGLACTLGGERPPPLILLDEPTNHLDLDGVAALEAGLRAYDGALVAVSHDEAFLEAIGVERRVVLGG